MAEHNDEDRMRFQEHTERSVFVEFNAMNAPVHSLQVASSGGVLKFYDAVDDPEGQCPMAVPIRSVGDADKVVQAAEGVRDWLKAAERARRAGGSGA